jgi:subtilisin-like proprotein convertase family protein
MIKKLLYSCLLLFFGLSINAQTTFNNPGELPLQIPDNPGCASHTITVTAGTITDADVADIDIAHAYTSDLEIKLISPSGTSVDLSIRNGAVLASADYIGTSFNDDATTPIAAGNGPFSGEYQPDSPLSALNGEEAAGDWTIKMCDFVDGDAGRLNMASIILTLEGAAGCAEPDVPTLTATPSTICAGSTATLSWTGDLNDATEWSIYEGSCGGTLVGTSVANSFDVNPSASTDYFVRGEGGCVTPGDCGTVEVTITSIDVTVTNASPTLTSNQDDATYRWLACDNGNAVVTGETSQSFTVTEFGNYAVEVTLNNCVDTSVCENVSAVGIQNNNNLNGVTIYPNPTKNSIYVTTENAFESANITLTTIEGRIVYQETNVSNNQVHIDLNTQSKGIYFLKIQADNQYNVYKIIKE